VVGRSSPANRMIPVRLCQVYASSPPGGLGTFSGHGAVYRPVPMWITGAVFVDKRMGLVWAAWGWHGERIRTTWQVYVPHPIRKDESSTPANISSLCFRYT